MKDVNFNIVWLSAVVALICVYFTRTKVLNTLNEQYYKFPKWICGTICIILGAIAVILGLTFTSIESHLYPTEIIHSFNNLIDGIAFLLFYAFGVMGMVIINAGFEEKRRYTPANKPVIFRQINEFLIRFVTKTGVPIGNAKFFIRCLIYSAALLDVAWLILKGNNFITVASIFQLVIMIIIFNSFVNSIDN